MDFTIYNPDLIIQCELREKIGGPGVPQYQGIAPEPRGKRRVEPDETSVCDNLRYIFSGLLTREELTTCVVSSVGCVERP